MKKKYVKLFEETNTVEKVQELIEQNILVVLHLLPIRFGGSDDYNNIVCVSDIILQLKERCDNLIEELLMDDKVNQYECIPNYKGDSFIPKELVINAKKDDKLVFTQIIDIW